MVEFGCASDVLHAVGFEPNRGGSREGFVSGFVRVDETNCVYCGCRVDGYDPVFVPEGSAGAASDAFWNDASLQVPVEGLSLTDGTTCEWSVSE